MPDRHSMVLQVDHIGYLDRGTVEGEGSLLPGGVFPLLRQSVVEAIETPLMYSIVTMPEF